MPINSWENEPVEKWAHFSWDYEYRRNLLNWMMEYSGGGASTILDIGCLHGQYIQKLRTLGYRGQYKGVDISKMFCEMAKKVNPAEEFECQDLNELKEKNASYHLAVCSHVIDHLYAITRPMWELFRVAERHVILGIMFSNGDSTVKHDYDFINHCYSLAEIFGNVPLGWTPIRSAVYHPEWDKSINILQCVWKRA